MLELCNITKKINNRILFKKVSYNLKKGKIYYLNGIVGSGKTSLLNILSNTDKNYCGAVYFNGVDIKNDSNYCLHCISYVRQDLNLYEDLKVIDNIHLICNYDSSKEKKLKYYVHYLNVKNLLNKKIKYLSGGEKQRVTILANLLKNAPILLLDEPFSFLDSKSIKLVSNLLKQEKKNKIIVITSHIKIDNSFYDDELSLDAHNKTQCIKNQKLGKIKNETDKKKYRKTFKMIDKTLSFYKKLCLTMITISVFFCGFSNILFTYLDNSINELFLSSKDNSLVVKQKYQEKDFDISDYDIDYEYYETINHEKIENIVINKIYFDSTLLNDREFILNNIYYPGNNKILLILPSIYYKENMIQENHILRINYNEDSFFTIPIHMVYFSESKECQLLSNNVDYFNVVKNDTDWKYYHLYSNDAEKLYKKLVNDKNLTNFSFYKNENYISYFKMPYSRITYYDFKDFININKKSIAYYVYSDNKNVYIDYQNQNIYPLCINKISHNKKSLFFDYESNYLLYEYLSINDNEIVVSLKMALEMNIECNDNLFLNINNKLQEMIVIEIDSSNQLNYAIKMNLNHLNSELLEDSQIYNIYLKLKPSKKIINPTSLLLSSVTIKVPQLSFVKLLSSFFKYTSYILILIALISISLAFEIMIIKKRSLYNKSKWLGYNVNYFNRYDYYSMLFLSLESAIIALLYVFITSIMLTAVISNIFKIQLNIYIDLKLYFHLFVGSLLAVNTLFFLNKRKMLFK